MPDIVGHERSAHDCAVKIAEAGKRVLLVHGQGAAEREAFVERGLAPFLEAPGRMFGFLRSTDGAMIRASQDPAATIAVALRSVATGMVQIGPVRKRHLPFDMEHAGIGPFHALAALTRVSTDTIVVVVTEPAITEATDSEDPFISFLRAVGETQIDAKVIVTLDDDARGRLKRALGAGRQGQSYVVDHRVR